MRRWFARRYGVRLMKWLWGPAGHSVEYVYTGKWKEGK